MNAAEFSKRYCVRALCEEDIPLIYQLCIGNPLYYAYAPPMVTEESIREDMKALPPWKAERDKHYVGYFDDGKLTAVMDLIDWRG